MILNHKILGQGPPLIILHGLFGSLDNWLGIGKSLSDQWTVYLVDLRNHGKSFHQSQFNFQVMSNDLLQLVNHLDLPHYQLMGHSMGGKVAMFHAQSSPDRVRQLVVVDIGPKSYPVHHQMILKGLALLDPRTLESRQQADDHLAEYVPEPGVRQFLLKNLSRNSSGSYQWKLNLKAISQNIESIGIALPGEKIIETPTLFVRGEHSHYIEEGDIAGINRQFPHAAIDTVQGAGHWVHAENPEMFLEIIRKFLSS